MLNSSIIGDFTISRFCVWNTKTSAGTELHKRHASMRLEKKGAEMHVKFTAIHESRT